MTEFREAVERAAKERVDFIMKNRERLIEAFVAETGLLPSQCELVERSYENGTVEVSVAPKPGAMACSRCKHSITNLCDDASWFICMKSGDHVEHDHYCRKFERSDGPTVSDPPPDTSSPR